MGGLIESGMNDVAAAEALVDGANYGKASAIADVARAKAALATAALVKARTIMDVSEYEARLVISLGEKPDPEAVEKIESAAAAIFASIDAI